MCFSLWPRHACFESWIDKYCMPTYTECMSEPSAQFLTPSDRRLLEAISKLTWCNPFTPQRIELERQVLGSHFLDAPEAWNLEQVRQRDKVNIEQITHHVEPLARKLYDRLLAGAPAGDEELRIYEDLIGFLLYHHYRAEFTRAILEASGHGTPMKTAAFWPAFKAEAEHYLRIPGRRLPSDLKPPHMLACCFQIRRAFVHLFNHIAGESSLAAGLRASVWQSIFTHDLGRYVRSRYRHMTDITTLITGPSGTGKELVARAIGMARYIPFDETTGQFVEDFAGSFFPLSLSALSPTLIESELFGHRRGAFTGAVGDRVGWFEACPPLGTVFLDEIGEVEPAIQVKLLRVLQTRTFCRLGETQPRRFLGKIVAATNRNLAQEIRTGRFREDFYYRLCSDTIITPSLRQLLDERPDDLHGLALFLARRVAGDEAEALADEVVRWVRKHLGPEYPWSGNIRELEQCVRSIWLHQRYEPQTAHPAAAGNGRQRLLSRIADGELDMEHLQRCYATLVFARSGSYEQAAKKLGLDWRTVKAKIDERLLKELEG